MNTCALHGIDQTIRTKVSIVIPTKNAGADFRLLLDSLRKQKYIAEIELIVIDSGSTDGTDSLAAEYGARIYRIHPDEFHHGKTRNLGASKTGGEYIVFMTQDAIPENEYLIFHLITAMQFDKKIMAVCPRQIARQDADFYASFNTWYFTNKHLELLCDTVVSVRKMNMLPIQKRKLASITDICCCLHRKTFLKYMFTMDYAEDLDLGIRLLQGGYKLCYLYNNCVVHSHNRPAAYTFKANYVTATTLPIIVGYGASVIRMVSLRDLYHAIIRLYSQLKYAVGQIHSTSTDEFMNMQGLLQTGLSSIEIRDCQGDTSLDSLFSEINGIIDLSSIDTKSSNFAFNHMLHGLVSIFPPFYQFAQLDHKEKLEKADLIGTFYKIFASAVGAELGNVAWYQMKHGGQEENVDRLNILLRRGI